MFELHQPRLLPLYFFHTCSLSLFHRMIVDALGRRSVLQWTSQLPTPRMRWSTAGHLTIIADGTAKNFFYRTLFDTFSARPGFFNRRKATRAITNDRATPIANVICGVIQRPTSA